MAANMYRVGDYVYFETSATAPYQIRRIEELTKTATGNVEARVMCYYRRRDISNTLLSQVDKHQNLDEDSQMPPASGEADGAESTTANNNNIKPVVSSIDGISEAQRHQLRHRELFLSRQVETLPATTIRGKCSVTLFNEAELPTCYLNREDAFYYNLVYDNSQKSLLVDRGQIRVGERFQAEIQPLLDEGQSDGRDLAQLEELVWRPDHGLASGDIDKFLLIARSVGTLARAVDACSAVRQHGLASAAASASRDVTQAYAFRLLHSANYELGRAFCRLATDSGPVLCRDQLEDWSAGECGLFEEGMDKHGKDFEEIRRDFLPWKSARAIVEYFYMWKTTDRYVQRKRLKASEAERKLKQVYIPNYTKPNPALLYNPPASGAAPRPCESCHCTSLAAATAASAGQQPPPQWYAWGPPHLSCRLCSTCWTYWKRYGGLKNPTRLEKAASPAPSAAAAVGSPASGGGVTLANRMHRCTVSGCDKEFRLRPQLVRHLTEAHGLDEASLLSHLQQQQSQQQQGGKGKSVKSMLMQANLTTRLARLLCPELLRLKRLARRPFDPAFDARPALRELPKRLRSSGRTPGQLLPDSRRSGKHQRRGALHRPSMETLLRGIRLRLASTGSSAADTLLLLNGKPDFLKPRSPGSTEARGPRAFPPSDAAGRIEFFRPLDDASAAAAAAAAAVSTVSNGVAGAESCDSPKPLQKQQAPTRYHQQPNANGSTAASAAAAAAAAAAEEIFLCCTRHLRAHLTTAQVRRAGRHPFKPLGPGPANVGTKPVVAAAAAATTATTAELTNGVGGHGTPPVSGGLKTSTAVAPAVKV